MARTIVKKYHIYEGPDEHCWTMGDPPRPVGRYKILQTVIVNDEVWEEPSKEEKLSLLPQVYTDLQIAQEEAYRLDKEWIATDPELQRYKSYGNKTNN